MFVEVDGALALNWKGVEDCRNVVVSEGLREAVGLVGLEVGPIFRLSFWFSFLVKTN